MISSASRAGRPPIRKGWIRRSIIIDERLYTETKGLARRQRATIRSVVEEALTARLTAEAASQNDAALLPLIDRLILERHRRLEAGLRSMMARVAYELLRSQYVWFNFMTEAGVSPGKINTWHEDGWGFAVKEFKRQGQQSRIDEENEEA